MVSPTQMSAAGVSLEVNTDTVWLSPEQFMVPRNPKQDVRTYIRPDVLSWWRETPMWGGSSVLSPTGGAMRVPDNTGEHHFLLSSVWQLFLTILLWFELFWARNPKLIPGFELTTHNQGVLYHVSITRNIIRGVLLIWRRNCGEREKTGCQEGKRPRFLESACGF